MDGMAKRSESLSRNCRLRLDLQFSDPQRWQPIYAGHVGHERLFARHGTESSSGARSEEHTSELQSHSDLVCRLLLEKKKPDPKITIEGTEQRPAIDRDKREKNLA